MSIGTVGKVGGMCWCWAFWLGWVLLPFADHVVEFSVGGEGLGRLHEEGVNATS